MTLEQIGQLVLKSSNNGMNSIPIINRIENNKVIEID